MEQKDHIQQLFEFEARHMLQMVAVANATLCEGKNMRPAESTGIRRKMTDDEINHLDQVVYDGPLHLVRSHKELLAAVRDLKKEKLVGFDTETRPSFKRGVTYPPALIQLAGRNAAYIFQLHITGLPQELTAILSNPRIIKTGVAIGRDVKELRSITDFEPRSFVDLGIFAKNLGLQHHGLRGLAAVVLGCKISKGAKLTRWDKPDLPRHALQYAATDAWIGRRIYEAMEKLTM